MRPGQLFRFKVTDRAITLPFQLSAYESLESETNNKSPSGYDDLPAWSDFP